jgi:hypothetical protein
MMQRVAVPTTDTSTYRVADTDGSFQDGIEYRLYVGRRARDAAEHLGSGCLLPQQLVPLTDEPLDVRFRGIVAERRPRPGGFATPL